MLPPLPHRDRREILHVFGRVLVPLALLFLVCVAFARSHGKSVGKLVGDPTAVIHVNPLVGFVSNLGIIGWCAGATVALFAAGMLARAAAPRETVRFHAWAGGFTALLMADDFFLIHDDLAQRYLHLPQNAVYAVYAALFAAGLVRCRRALPGRNPALFVVAIALLGLMVVPDALDLARHRLIALAMVGSKFLGIYAWSAALVLAARRDLEAARTDSATSAAATVSLPPFPSNPPLSR